MDGKGRVPRQEGRNWLEQLLLESLCGAMTAPMDIYVAAGCAATGRATALDDETVVIEQPPVMGGDHVVLRLAAITHVVVRPGRGLPWT